MIIPRSPRRPIARRTTALFLALSLVATAPALAQTTEGNAKERFVEAQSLYDSGEFGAALPIFQEVYDITQSPNAQLYVARSLRELGRNVEAHEAMKGLLEIATERAKTEEKYVPTRDAAAAELALLEQRIGRITVAFADPPDSLSVRVAGKDVPSDRIGTPIAVNPGDVPIEAEAPDHETLNRTISIGPGQSETLALVLEPIESPGGGFETMPDKPESGGLSGLQIAGIVTAGVGVVGIGIFAITGSASQSKFSDIETECGGTRCTDPAYADEIDSGKTLETVANVSLVAGGALVLVGAGLFIFGGDDGGSKELEASSRVRFAPSLTGGALEWSGTF